MYQIAKTVQMALEDFELPFEGFLDADNRWVQMSGYVGLSLKSEV
jgi:hypothetical protein